MSIIIGDTKIYFSQQLVHQVSKKRKENSKDIEDVKTTERTSYSNGHTQNVALSR